MLRAVVSWADTARARETRGQSAETTQQSKQILGDYYRDKSWSGGW